MREVSGSFTGFLLMLILFPTLVVAQQNNRTQGSRLNLNLDTESAAYYIDQMGSSFQGVLPYDPSFDIEQYVLGPGDLLTVTIQSSQTYIYRSLLVNTSGDITLPGLGVYAVGGRSIAEAKMQLQQESEDIYSNPAVYLSLERAKPLSIFINGTVPSPGKKTLPAFSRVDLAVFSAFNPVNIQNANSGVIETNKLLGEAGYSLRNIKIERASGEMQEADLISFFRLGTPADNPILFDGDQIKILKLDARHPRISISGGVNDPLETEYRSSDSIQLLIRLAGGITTDGDASKVLVFRSNENGIETIELNNSEWDSFHLMPNDRVVIPRNQAASINASAWVYGEVQLPGNFPIRHGSTTANELLELSGLMTANALPHAAYLVRAGAFENEVPDKFNTDLLKRTSDQLAQGFDYLNLETQLSKGRVYIDLTDPQQLQTVRLFDGDKLYIPRDEQTIFVFGQVNNPGYYSYAEGSPAIESYINRAGGFALSADQERIFIIKAGSGTWYQLNETSLESGDRIFVDRVPFDELNARRNYEIQRQQLRNQRTQLILTGITTITGIVTTYVAIQNLSN